MVKNGISVNVPPEVPPWVRAVLAGLPGVRASQSGGADLLLSVDGQVMAVQLKSSRSVDGARARMIADAPRPEDVIVIVVADTTTAQARETLEAAGVGYVDAHGNAHVRAPGVFLHVATNTRSSTGATRTPTRLSGKAGLVAQVLVVERNRAWQVGEIAEATGGHNDHSTPPVSIGLVHRVLVRLEQLGLLHVEGSGPRRRRVVTEPSALLDLLREENDEPHLQRRPIYVYEPIPGSLGSSLSQRLALHGIHHALTGTAAAVIEAPMLTAVPVTEVRIAAGVDLDAATSILTARSVDKGANCVLLQGQDDVELALRRRVRDLWLAAPPRVYLDCLRDPRRGEEQAEHYRQEVLRL